MTEAEIRAALAKLVARIAPEADLAAIDPGESLQRALDIDSFDFLSLLVAVRDELGVTVSESDYGKVGSLQGLVSFLAPRLKDRRGS
jgi:acyl carrier protein